MCGTGDLNLGPLNRWLLEKWGSISRGDRLGLSRRKGAQVEG